MNIIMWSVVMFAYKIAMLTIDLDVVSVKRHSLIHPRMKRISPSLRTRYGSLPSSRVGTSFIQRRPHDYEYDYDGHEYNYDIIVTPGLAAKLQKL